MEAFQPWINPTTSYPRAELQEVFHRIQNHQISEIRITPDLKEIFSITEKEIYMTNVNSYLLPKIIDTSIENSVKTTFLQEPVIINPFITHLIQNPFGTIYENIFPLCLLYFVFQRFRAFQKQTQFMNKGKGNPTTSFGNPFMGFGREEDEFSYDESITSNISLSDWAGSPEIFYECYEIISYLQNATDFKAVGAEIPRGILLEGPPGTGKTLLARAIASEVNATFISVVGSQFIEMFVGVGALRIRELFQNARENRPCVLFIDEIDAIGKKRGMGFSGGGSGNDEREQTLNQLLAEMDGFQDNEGILVMAATNLKDSLDKALIRPGRFDRIISVPLPDTSSREKILHKYLDSKPVIQSKISVKQLAEFTDGFSGAELKNLVNEGLIHMIRRMAVEKTLPTHLSNFFSDYATDYVMDENTGDIINQPTAVLKPEDMNQALEKILIGIVKQNDSRSMEIQRRVALHELGHAIMVVEHSDDFDLQKVSIQNTYSGIGGFTLFKAKQELTEGGLYTKSFLEKQLQIMLGGRATEEIFYGSENISLGATKDLEEANNLAKKMVEQYGMGSGKFNVYSRVNSEFQNMGLSSSGDISEKTKYQLERESYHLVACAYEKTLEKIRTHKTEIDKLSVMLSVKRVFYGNPFYYFDSLFSGFE